MVPGEHRSERGIVRVVDISRCRYYTFGEQEAGRPQDDTFNSRVVVWPVMPLVTDEEHAFFRENGYVKLEGVVPEALCEAVIDDIFTHTGRDRDDPETWYDPPKGLDEQFSSAGMLEMYHRQSMWDVRQHRHTYQAFAELLGTEQLWVSIDRVNMTPPSHEEHPELDYGFVHWDVTLEDVPRPVPQPHGVQGVVYLDDTTRDQGGFCCVPELFGDIDADWLDDRVASRDNPSELTEADLDDYEVEAIPGEQGDLVIWDRLCPHGNGRNQADDPRFAQYVLMSPEGFRNVERREERIDCWRNSSNPAGSAFPGDPRELEAETPPAHLTPLGRKLLGLDPWGHWL